MPPEKSNLENEPQKKAETLSDIAESVQRDVQEMISPGAKESYTPNPELKTLRTFQGDMEETIHRKNESIVSIATAEQTTKKKEVPAIVPQRSGGKFLTHGILPFAGLILIIVGAITLTIIYYFMAINSAPVPVTPQTALISSGDRKDVALGQDIRGDIIQNLVSNKTSFTGSVDSTLYIRFLQDKQELPAANFFQNIGPNAPPSLTRSFTGSYMAGIYSFDTSEIFFIFSTPDYGLSYSGMLKWENMMANDLSPFFSINQSQFAPSTAFQDDSFNNHDVRVIRDSNGTVILMYGFIDKNTLVITANEKIFQSIASKFINSKLVH